MVFFHDVSRMLISDRGRYEYGGGGGGSLKWFSWMVSNGTWFSWIGPPMAHGKWLELDPFD